MPDSFNITTPTGGVSVANATTKSVIGYNAPATIRPLLGGYKVSVDDGAATDDAIEVTVFRSTTAGTATANTPKLNDPGAQAALGTAGHNYTVEPTKTDEIDRQVVPVAGGGIYEYTWPLGEEPRIPASGRVVIEVKTGAQTRLVTAKLVIKE